MRRYKMLVRRHALVSMEVSVEADTWEKAQDEARTKASQIVAAPWKICNLEPPGGGIHSIDPLEVSQIDEG